MRLNQIHGLMCAFCVLATFSQIPSNYRWICKAVFSRFISLSFVMIKENLETVVEAAGTGMGFH